MISRGTPVHIIDLDRKGVVVCGDRHGFGMGWTYEVSLDVPMREGTSMVKTVWRRESLLKRIDVPEPYRPTGPRLVVDNEARFVKP